MGISKVASRLRGIQNIRIGVNTCSVRHSIGVDICGGPHSEDFEVIIGDADRWEGNGKDGASSQKHTEQSSGVHDDIKQVCFRMGCL